MQRIELALIDKALELPHFKFFELLNTFLRDFNFTAFEIKCVEISADFRTLLDFNSQMEINIFCKWILLTKNLLRQKPAEKTQSLVQFHSKKKH